MKTTFLASLALTAACLLLAGCEIEDKTIEEDDPGKYLRYDKYGITEILCAAGAEQESMAEEIEADMQASAPFAVGDKHLFAGSQWTVTSPDGTELADGTFVFEPEETYPEAFSLLLSRTQTQIITWRKMTIDTDGGESVYYLFIVRYELTRANFSPSYYDIWIYEDLTGYYQELYPDAGVNGAVRAQICKRTAAI